MGVSTAIGQERLARVSGYKIARLFRNDTTNLPQRIAILGQANTANQGTLSTTKTELTSASQAASLYGNGSPIHQAMRILRPISSDGVGGIPTVVFPQEEPSGATATSNTWTITGSPTANATHSVVVNGRRSVDFENYSYTVLTTDTNDNIASKIADAINSVTASPVTALASTNTVVITTKYKGAESAELKTRIDNNQQTVGVIYTQTSTTTGTGSVDLAPAFAQFQNDWFTIVLNPYGSVSTILEALEAFNGIPDPDTPTGRWQGRVFMPFVSFFGSSLNTVASLSAITDAAARKNQVTNVLCAAPNSEAFSGEIAANVVVLHSRTAQDTPHLDINNKSYPDCPTPDNLLIGEMSDYNNRDFLVKKGCSTVLLENGAYVVQDLVTTYHPEGENVFQLQFNYPRNLNVDWNMKDALTILENKNVRDHVILLDGQVSGEKRTVTPKRWKAILYAYYDDAAERALIQNPQASKDALDVQINSTNRDRFDTTGKYTRTGTARITSTDVEVSN